MVFLSSVARFGRVRRLVRGEGSLAAAVLEAVQMDYEVNVKANLASQMGTTDAVSGGASCIDFLTGTGR
jgi:hypothetical protein